MLKLAQFFNMKRIGNRELDEWFDGGGATGFATQCATRSTNLTSRVVLANLESHISLIVNDIRSTEKVWTRTQMDTRSHPRLYLGFRVPALRHSITPPLHFQLPFSV